MFKGKNVKKVLKKALQAKEDNLILLHLDRYHAKKIAESLRKRNAEEEKEYKKLEKELDLERKKPRKVRNKERIIEIENRIEIIRRHRKELERVWNDVNNYNIIIEKAKFLIETIKECIENPQKLE